MDKECRSQFGIDIKAYCKDHESAVLEAIADDKATPAVLETHREKIRFLQHERLVHLIVTFMVTVIELFVVDLTLFHSDELGIGPAVMMLLLAVLLGLYFLHYFFLENTVQRWYKILEELESRRS